EWPKFQQTVARATLDNMINALTMVLQNLKEVSTRGRPTIASQHNSTNSTRRDPSGFELVEHKDNTVLCVDSLGTIRVLAQVKGNVQN
ncbi:16412_t:CDS:1, partial [Dentiscutata heterogama]